MTDAHYSIARAMAGEWMAEPVPIRFSLSRGIPDCLPKAKTAIYITERSDGRTTYVGQTRQSVGTRLAQHARDWDRSTQWAWVWVVPVRSEVSRRQLDRIESRIGTWLRPTDCVRLPRP